MKIKLISLVCYFISFNCIGQDKIVKIKSDSLFVRFFYQSNKSTHHTENDTIYYLTKRINYASFMLNKNLKGKLVWSKIIHSIIAKDSLVVNTKMIDIKGKSKISKMRAKYYLGIEIP